MWQVRYTVTMMTESPAPKHPMPTTQQQTPNTNLAAHRVSGTEVHYFVLCPRKLWWFSHGMEQEHVSGTSGAESVSMGQLLHQDAYPDREHRDVMIDNLLRLDFTESGQVQEVKKSRGGLKATRFQL